MTKMILEFEQNLVDLAIFEAKEPVDVSIAEQVAEWKKLKKKFVVMDKISKLVTSRIKELEESFNEVIKDVEGNKKIVDGCILEYAQKRSNQTVKYKESVDYAMKMMNEAQQKVLQAFVDSVTKAPEITDVLAVTDPDLEQFILDLKKAPAEDLLDKAGDVDKFPRQIALAKKRDLKEGVLDNITKVIKRAVTTFKTKFAKLFKAFTTRDNATDALMKAVKATKVAEAKITEAFKVEAFQKDPKTVTEPAHDQNTSSNKSQALSLAKGWVKQGYFVSITDTISGEVLNDYKPGDKVLEAIRDQSLNEEDFGKWSMSKDGNMTSLYRFSGKTWPCINYDKSTGIVYARNDNGSRPSTTIKTTELTVAGVMALINGEISTPLPSKEAIEALLGSLKEAKCSPTGDSVKGGKDKGPYKAVEDDEPGFKGKWRVEDSIGGVIMDDLTKEEARDLADSKNEKDGKKQVVAIDEVKNEFGEVEYSSFITWKSAIKRLNPGAWFDGDKDICNAFTGTKPYKRKETLGVGEWDGEKGVVYKAAPKKAMTESIDKSKENMDKREYKMGRIESVFGTLESLEWSKLNDADMDAIFDKLTELKLVKYNK